MINDNTIGDMVFDTLEEVWEEAIRSVGRTGHPQYVFRGVSGSKRVYSLNPDVVVGTVLSVYARCGEDRRLVRIVGW